MKDARLDSPGEKFQLNGAATLKGTLDFKLAARPNNPAATAYTITGTLADPRVIRSVSSETQAKLKAEPPK
jgi:hypothetical protein